MLYDKHLAPAFSRLDRAKQPGRAAANYNGVIDHLSKIACFQNVTVMTNMPGHYVGQCPHRDRPFVGGADASRGLVREIVYKEHIRTPLQVKFIKELGKRAVVGVRILYVAVLLKALDRR